ncbi:MAG: FecR domain-containing protein [Verrucomicrobia bacterium]|nr:FecR domain-containing protein [Verrucomicrobiota bacterium]
MIDKDLQDLLAAWHGADVRGVRRGELLGRLRADSDFRRRFAEEIAILSEIKAVQSTVPRWLRVADSLGWETVPPDESGDAPDDGDAAFEARVLQRIKGECIGPANTAPRRFRWWPYAAAALVLLGATLKFAGPWQRQSLATGGDAPQVPETQPLAVLVGAVDVSWQEGGNSPGVGDTLTKGKLGCDSGRFTFSMLNGVTVSAEAPVELDLVALDSVVCRRGKLRVRVPKGAEGFSVNSPECTVVDRGTEFAVNVSPGEPTDVMVFDGQADVFVESKANGGRVGTSVMVAESVRVIPGADRPLNIEANPRQFTTMLPADVVPLNLPANYRDLVLSSKPWGYWRFESEIGGVLPNEVAGGPGFRMRGDIGFRQHSRSNRSLVFPGEGGDLESLLRLEKPWHPSPVAGYAVELWFEAENFSNSTLVSLLSTEQPMPHNNHHMVLEIVANKQEMGNVRFLHRWPAGPSLGVNLNSRRIYVPCRWTHLVAQRNGERLQLYVDGELANETPLDRNQSIGPCHVLLGRLLTPDFGAPPNMRRLYRGGLDEVAFYDRPLSPEEIRSHHDAAK